MRRLHWLVFSARSSRSSGEGLVAPALLEGVEEEAEGDVGFAEVVLGGLGGAAAEVEARFGGLNRARRARCRW
jgi:hypothetical protein